MINQLHEIQGSSDSTSALSASDWRKINQLKAVVGVRGDRQTKKGRLLPFDQSDNYCGGAVIWSHRSVQRACDRQGQLDHEKEQMERQKASQIETRRANHSPQARLAEKRCVEHAADRELAVQCRDDDGKKKQRDTSIRRPAGPDNDTKERPR